MKQRLLTIIIAADIFIFALLTLGNCKRNETISSAAWSLEQDGKLLGRIFRPAIDWFLQRIEPNHCAVSWWVENKIELWNGVPNVRNPAD